MQGQCGYGTSADTIFQERREEQEMEATLTRVATSFAKLGDHGSSGAPPASRRSKRLAVTGPGHLPLVIERNRPAEVDEAYRWVQGSTGPPDAGSPTSFASPT